jgi:hypothetical protein
VAPLGRLYLRNLVSARLRARLRIEDYLRRNPSIAQLPVPRPVIILGLPRTGTTVLHRLLAQDPAARAPIAWEMEHVAPPPTPQDWETHAARALAERTADVRSRLSRILGTRFDHIHETGPNLPEECTSLLANYLHGQLFSTVLGSQDYLAYLRATDARPAYEAHRLQLQILQSPFPDRRWVLKAPYHMRHIRLLASIYPDAVFVFTHRDPLEVLPSTASLISTARTSIFRQVDRHATAVEVRDLLTGMLERALEDRAILGGDGRTTIIDVCYQQIRRDPLGVAREIYERAGLPLSDEAVTAMTGWFAANRQHKHGKHAYSLEEFGLAPAEERRRFGSYYDAYGALLTQAEHALT